MQPGDTVKVNQIIVEIETAKAVVELPSPHAGMVSELLVAEGDTVDVGTPIISDRRPARARGRTGSAAAPPANIHEQRPAAGRASRRPSGARLGGRQRPGRGSSADLVPADGPRSRRPTAEPAKRQAGLVGYGVKLAPRPGGRASRRRPGAGARRRGGAASPRRPAARPAQPRPAGRSQPRPRWPSRRSASSPATSASTWPR